MTECRCHYIWMMSLFVVGGVRSAQELYVSLKSAIENTIHEGHFSVDEIIPKQVSHCCCLFVVFVYCLHFTLFKRNILRIGLQSLGSPLWLDEGGVSDSSHSLLQFLHCLRALLRRAYAVAMVTVPTHLMKVGLSHSLLLGHYVPFPFVFTSG